MNLKTMLAALQGITAYKDLLTQPVMERALRLVACAAHGDGLGGLEAYTDLFYQLRVEGYPGLGQWLGDALRWSEGPYPMLAQRGVIDGDAGLGGTETVEGAIADIRSAVVEGSTVYFIMLIGDDAYYSVSVADQLLAVTLSKGDQVSITFHPGRESILSGVSLERK